MNTQNYSIVDGNGNQLAQDIQGDVPVKRAAQRLANERGESVWYYPIPVQTNDEGESVDEGIEVTPE